MDKVSNPFSFALQRPLQAGLSLLYGQSKQQTSCCLPHFYLCTEGTLPMHAPACQL